MSKPAQVYHLPAHKQLVEPRLKFGALDPEALDTHPLRGLAAFGPFSKNRLAGVVDPIRIAFIGQQKMVDRLDRLLKEIERSHEPRDGRVYRPSFPGFSAVFDCRLVRAPDAATIVLPDSLDQAIASAEQPHIVLAEALTGALSSLRSQRHAFNVILIGLDDRWAAAFKETETEDFDLLAARA